MLDVSYAAAPLLAAAYTAVLLPRMNVFIFFSEGQESILHRTLDPSRFQEIFFKIQSDNPQPYSGDSVLALSYPSQDYHLTRSHIILTFLQPTRSDLLRPRRQSPSKLQHLKQSYRCDTRKDARRELVVRGAVTLGASQRAGGSCRRRLTLNLDEDMTRKLVISSSEPLLLA